VTIWGVTYTCDTVNERNGKQGVIKAIKFLFMSMKKHKINPIGPFVLEYLKDHASALYKYLSKKKPNEELVAKDLTDYIDKHLSAGFVLHWDDCLNYWMVDYNIICILKGYVDIHHGPMCQQNKGSFVTETTTKM
jgi:hypothetical protein